MGTPGAVVKVSIGCGDYTVFGSVLTLLVTKSNVTAPAAPLYNIVTFVDSGCTGAIGVLFVDIKANGACYADTVMDRYEPERLHVAVFPPIRMN